MHELELHWIHSLQNILRAPFTDTFFILWDYVDTVWFVLIFIAIITYLFNRKEGISLLFLFILSAIMSVFLKKIFNSSRPCQIDPSVGLLCHLSLGFPSGAAQTATIIAGAAFAKCRQNVYKIGALIFALFLCFSRVYLGVHFFSDILGGIGVGIVLLAIYLKIFPLIENHWGKFSIGLSLLLLVLGGAKMAPQIGMILGVGFGVFLSKGAKLPIAKSRRVLSLFLSLLGASMFIYLGELCPPINPLARFFAGVWFVYIGEGIAKLHSEPKTPF